MLDSINQVHANPILGLSQSNQAMLCQIGQLGWFYDKIKFNISNQQSYGYNKKIATSVFYGVQQQLGQYYKWLAIMQGMIRTNDLNLRKLILWSYQPTQILKWIKIIIQSIQPYSGCHIISMINSFRPNGSTTINQLLYRILTYSLKPFFKSIQNWINNGKIQSYDDQFFVSQSKLQKGQNQWQKKFYLQQKNIPNVIDYQSAIRIFNIGKTVYFLKQHCGINYQLTIPKFNFQLQLSNNLIQQKNIVSQNFKKWISNAYTYTGRKLLQIMFDKYNLKKHFQNLKAFYMMGKGDFIDGLIDLIDDQISKTKHQFSQHYIQTKLQQLFVKYFNSKDKNQQQLVYRLRYKRVTQNGSWDAPHFGYSVPQIPLFTVFHDKIMSKYQKIFNFLFKIKKIQTKLKDMWLYSAKQKSLRHLKKYQFFKQCDLMRHKMLNFVNCLIDYIFTTIQSSYKIFFQRLNNAITFDQVLSLHQNLINQIYQITFISINKVQKSQYSLISLIKQIFTCIFKFCGIQRKIKQQKIPQFKKDCKDYQMKQRIKKLGISNQFFPLPTIDVQKQYTQISNTNRQFKKIYDKFIQLLRKDPQNRKNNLALRLDLSGYYSSKQQIKLSKS